MVTSARVAGGLTIPLPGRGLRAESAGEVKRSPGRQEEEDGGRPVLKAQPGPSPVHARWAAHADGASCSVVGGDGCPASVGNFSPWALPVSSQVGRLSSLWPFFLLEAATCVPKVEAKALRPLSFLEGRLGSLCLEAGVRPSQGRSSVMCRFSLTTTPPLLSSQS